MEEGEKCEPTYDLAQIQRLAKAKRYVVLSGARTGLFLLRWDEDDMVDCILGLGRSDFYKSMPSKQAPGTFQDVYRPTYLEVKLYVKLQLNTEARAVIIQFKGRH